MTTGLKERLRTDLTDSLRARDQIRTATIRMALTAVTNEEVAGKSARELSDDDVIGVLQREAKRRREAVQAYDDANRSDLANRERAELEVLAGYLPAPLDESALAELVSAAIDEVRASQPGAEGPRAMGAVMKVVTPQVAGRADGSAVADEVKRQLGIS
jgi:uncharacterized protein